MCPELDAHLSHLDSLNLFYLNLFFIFNIAYSFLVLTIFHLFVDSLVEIETLGKGQHLGFYDGKGFDIEPIGKVHIDE